MTFKLYFMTLEAELFFNSKHNFVTDGVIMLPGSNQVLCNMVIWLLWHELSTE